MKKKSIIILSVILIGVICLFCFVKEDETNLETKEKEVIATNKNTSLAFTVNGKETDIAFPKKDTGYLGEKVECTNNVEALWNNETWKLEISNISTTTNCKINFIEYNPYLYSKILEDNPNVSERTNFNEIFTESNNGNTIYKASGQDGADTYYFAGNVTNNYVKFGTDASGNELYWRIVRVNEDNSVRLIYAGTSAEDTAAFISTSQAFNETANSSEYAGYMYTLGSQHGTGTNSDIKDTIDTWYTNNLTEEDKYISKTAIYCNDRTVTTGSWSSAPTSMYYNSAYTRIITNASPSYSCNNEADRFTVSGTTGNGKLTNAIALLNADEAAFAGSINEADNTTYYLADNAKSSGNYWYLMTPSSWHSEGYIRNFFISSAENIGRLGFGISVTGKYSVRPVLSLKACVQYASGNGTAEKPYEVKLSESCESVENEVLDENVVRVSATTNDSTMATVTAPASVLKNIGDSHTFTFNVTEGYTYKNVEGCTGTYNETDNTLTISSIATSTTCKVSFEKITYEVNVSSNNTSYGTVSPTTQTVEEGGSVTVTLSPNTGYKYSSNTCGGTVSGNTMTISNITEAKTCTVTFTTDSVTFTLATSANRDTINSATTGAACYYVRNYYGGYNYRPTTTTFSYTYNGTTYNNCSISGTPTCKYNDGAWSSGSSFSCASGLGWFSTSSGVYGWVNRSNDDYVSGYYAGCSATVTCS